MAMRSLSMIAGWAALIPFTLLLYLLAVLHVPRAWYRQLFHLWCKNWVYALGVRLRLYRHNRSPLPRTYILIANHPSVFEDIGIPALFDADSLAKQEVRRWFVVGKISEAAGTLYVKRESRASRKEAGEQIRKTLGEGRSVALYPEGGVKGMRVHPFRYGAFDISLRTGVPVVPVFIHYEPQRAFFWGHELLPMKLWQIMRTHKPRADYHLFDAFEPGEFSSVEAYCETVHQHYLEWQVEYLEP